MATTILGIFDDPSAARRAMEDLRDSPLELEDVSIITRATEHGEAVSDEDHLSAGQGAAIGAVWGGLVGLTALLIPGIGPFIAGGALFAALTGAATGAIVGGIAGALMDRVGISEEEARQYEQMVQQGKTLIAVKAHDEDASQVRRILASEGADEVHDGYTDAPPARAAVTSTTPAANTTASGSKVHVAMYDERGKRVDMDPTGTRSAQPAQGRFTSAASTAPVAASTTTVETQPTQPVDQGLPRGKQWTSGEDVGEGQGAGPRKDTGTYDARQWVGEGQGKPDDEDTPKKRS